MKQFAVHLAVAAAVAWLALACGFAVQPRSASAAEAVVKRAVSNRHGLNPGSSTLLRGGLASRANQPVTCAVLKGHGFSRADQRKINRASAPEGWFSEPASTFPPTSPTDASLNIPVIFTAAPLYDERAALHGGERFPRGAQLMLLRDGHITPLVPQLAASADASVSFDGKAILFAGKKNAGDPWRIWQMPLSGGQPTLVLAAPTDLIRPLWMPGGRLVYARRQPTGFTMETAALDGSSRLRLSYVPGNFIPDDVLRDGRVLFESGFPLGAAVSGGSLVLKGHGFSRADKLPKIDGASAPEASSSSRSGLHRGLAGANPEIYTVYADGSGEEAVRCDHEAAQRAGGRARARQMPTGDIVFAQAGHLARFTSTLANEASIPAPPGDYAGDVAALPDGRWLLSVRRPEDRHYAIALWTPPAAARFPGDPEARAAAPALITAARDPKLDFIEPVPVEPRPIPNRHPSGLHPWTTGNLLALDARLSRSGELSIAPARVRVESLSPTGSTVLLGIAPVAHDGSFFVRAAADRPLRFVLLDAHGHVLRQERGWFWIRPGEQRVCVGCHTGPERAPNNRLPGILQLSTTPANASGAAQPAVQGAY